MKENDIKVRVTYPDNHGNYETTIGEVKDKFKEETKEWLDYFIERIINEGHAYTRFGGKYERIN